MTHSVTTGQALYEQSSFSSIFRDWLLGQDDLGSAAGEWNRFTSAPLGLKTVHVPTFGPQVNYVVCRLYNVQVVFYYDN